MKYFDLSKINIKNEDFKKWKKKADDLKKELNKCKNKEERKNFFYDEKNGHWKKIKKILILTFGKLCWYSDCKLVGQYGDVDHFRPKSRSIDYEGKVILDSGYWWLAYDYKNYRLSCQVVNRRNQQGGKVDYFPLKNTPIIARDKVQINKEEPLLLDPCNLEDTKLIGYREGGIIVSESDEKWDRERVEKSTKIYNLNEFIEDRKDIIARSESIIDRFRILHSKDVIDNDEIKIWTKDINLLLNPEKEYSSVAYNYIMFLSNMPCNQRIKNEIKDIINDIYIL